MNRPIVMLVIEIVVVGFGGVIAIVIVIEVDRVEEFVVEGSVVAGTLGVGVGSRRLGVDYFAFISGLVLQFKTC